MRRNLGRQPVCARSGGPADRPTADCAQCFGLCCVALPFSASTDFAIDRSAGPPCVHVADDFACREHSRLRSVGFSGCTVYDCFGAGQQVAQVTFRGISWRREPASAALMFESLSVMRQLHELLWYLQDASTRPAAARCHQQVGTLRTATEGLTALPAQQLLDVDVRAHRAAVDQVLQRVSGLVRADVQPVNDLVRRNFRRADLAGRRLRGTDLRGADLRGAVLLGADLRGADLRSADLIGADLRGAAVHGADLSSSLFLTQFQLNAAAGDPATALSPPLNRPAHWLRELPDEGRAAAGR